MTLQYQLGFVLKLNTRKKGSKYAVNYNLDWSNGIQIRNSSVENPRYLSLLLVARLMDTFRLSTPLSKTLKIT